jgi:nitrous oxide reductase accessory protein NosL
MRRRVFCAGILAGLLRAGHAAVAVPVAPVKPGPADKCPVCGMFVARYPDVVAQVIYRDGGYAVFDGVKDMFKYLFDLRAYAPSRAASDIAAIYVTDYYSLFPVDGRRAWYVLGSDVHGPMGHELIPLEVEKEAREFMADHKGTRLLRFGEVTPGVVRTLD